MIAAAVALAVAFAPPLNHPLRYDIEESQPLPGGGDARFTLHQEARFARDGDGYALALRATGFASAAPPAERAKIAAGTAPMIGVPLVLRLAPDGTAIGVIDGEANWRALIAGLRAAAALPGAPPGRRLVAEQFAALSHHDRDLQLLEAADDIVPRVAGGDTHRHAETDRPQPGGAMLHVVEEVETSADSGLVLHRHVVRTVRPHGGGAPVPLGQTDTRLVGY